MSARVERAGSLLAHRHHDGVERGYEGEAWCCIALNDATAEDTRWLADVHGIAIYADEMEALTEAMRSVARDEDADVLDAERARAIRDAMHDPSPACWAIMDGEYVIGAGLTRSAAWYDAEWLASSFGGSNEESAVVAERARRWAAVERASMRKLDPGLERVVAVRGRRYIAATPEAARGYAAAAARVEPWR